MSNYSGIKTVCMTDTDLEKFYGEQATANEWLNMENNQYLVITRPESSEVIGPYRFNGRFFEQVSYRVFSSHRFGDIKPMHKDPYQMAYMDSLERNQLTFCTGPAGSGKTQIALAYAFQEIEKGKLDKLIIFTNPYIAQDAVKLGFMPGSKTEKLLETSIGSILISKLGSRLDVEEMINRERIVLMPMGDCRGYEVPPDSFVYFSEAQNMSKYLMQLFLQRLNDDCKICIEGDIRQADKEAFMHKDSGLQRAIDVFKGEDYAGHVQLKTIYRGRIARKAEEICD